MPEIPSRFAATGAETAIAITRTAVEQRIGMCLTLPPGHLDAARLARAARLTLDAEPTVGCAFRTDERKAYWQRLSKTRRLLDARTRRRERPGRGDALLPSRRGARRGTAGQGCTVPDERPGRMGYTGSNTNTQSIEELLQLIAREIEMAVG